MATVLERHRKDGGSSYRVQWVMGGGRYVNQAQTPRATETFTSRERAESFKEDVERCGSRWPEGWVKGQGYVKPIERLQGQVMFDEVAQQHFAFEDGRVIKGRKLAYTQQRNRREYELHIKPSFGPLAFAAFDDDDIEQWFELQASFGASPKSVRNRHGVLSMITKFGQKRLKLRPDNPCELSELPLVENTRDVRFLHHGEWSILRQCMRRDAQQIADMMLMTAARWGEISAIQVGDCLKSSEDVINIQLRRVWTKRAVNDPAPISFELGETKSWKIKNAPKNRESRFVSVSGDVARELLAGMAGKRSTDYLFTTREGNPWRYPDFHADRWKGAVHLAKQSGLTRDVVTIHMLRHTSAVWALAAGRPIHEVSMMMGHKDIRTTRNIYGGALNMYDPSVARALQAQMAMARSAILPSTMPTGKDVDDSPVRIRPRAQRRAAG